MLPIACAEIQKIPSWNDYFVVSVRPATSALNNHGSHCYNRGVQNLLLNVEL